MQGRRPFHFGFWIADFGARYWKVRSGFAVRHSSKIRNLKSKIDWGFKMDNKVQDKVSMDTIVSLAKRRGFVFPSSEIYGGFGSTWDYGPLGTELKRNVKNAWWQANVQERDDVVGLDSAILMAPAVWAASGHLANFTDPLVDCTNCKMRWRADHLTPTPVSEIKGYKPLPGQENATAVLVCPNCGSWALTQPRNFNLMFKTYVGPVEEDAAVAYLRPETAQGIFVNF